MDLSGSGNDKVSHMPHHVVAHIAPNEQADLCVARLRNSTSMLCRAYVKLLADSVDIHID